MVAPPRQLLGETFSIEEQYAKKDALKKLLDEQREQLKGLSSVPGTSGSGVYPTTTQALSSSAVSKREEPDDKGFKETLDEKPSITAGDILSGNVDPESVDIDVMARRARKDSSAEDDDTASTAVRKPIRQNFPSVGDETQEKRPLRQKLLLDADSNIPPRPAAPGAVSRSQPKGSDDRFQISEEDKKKASKWGINIDKLL